MNFTDDYIYTGDLDPIDFQEGLERINLRNGLRGDNWMLMLYGRNITDESIRSGGADVLLRRVRTCLTTVEEKSGVFRRHGSFNFP